MWPRKAPRISRSNLHLVSCIFPGKLVRTMCVDLGLKAVPRCPHASTLSILYTTQIKFFPHFQTQISELICSQDNVPIGMGSKIIVESPAFHAKKIYDITQNRLIRDHIGAVVGTCSISKAAYHALLYWFHPVGSVHNLFVGNTRRDGANRIC